MRNGAEKAAYLESLFSEIYVNDLVERNGIRNARMNFRQVEPTHAMENIVYNELRGRGFGVDVGVVTKYVRDEGGKQSGSPRSSSRAAARPSSKSKA